MKMKDFLKGEAVAVENCPMRDSCPIGMLCATEREDNAPPLFPTVLDVDQGELLWTDLRSEQRVFVINSGVFSCVAHVDGQWETPFALYGSGAGIGLAELYVPRKAADTYHLRALIPGRVCSLLSKPLRRHLESLETPMPEKILSRALVNMSTAALLQSMVVSRPLLRDRVAMLLSFMQELAARGGTRTNELPITHGEIAQLVMSDRGSVTRVLRAMEQEGAVELGYRLVRVSDAMRPGAQEAQDICSHFYFL